MTNTTITTSKTALNNIAVDYSKAVERMTVRSLVLLTHCKEFRDNYGFFMKAKNKKKFMATAVERLEVLITSGELDVAFRAVPGVNRSIEIVERALREMYSGLIIVEQTMEEAAREANISFIEKTVYMGKIIARMQEMATGDAAGERFIVRHPQMCGIWNALNEFSRELLSLPEDKRKALGLVMDDMGVRKEFTVAYNTCKQYQGFTSAEGIKVAKYYPGTFVTQTYNGLNVHCNPKSFEGMGKYYLDRSTSSSELVKFTIDTLSPATIKAVGQVLFLDSMNQLHRFNIHSYGDYGVNLQDKVASNNEIGFLQIQALLSTFNIEFSSLMADSRNFCILNYREAKVKNEFGQLVLDRRYVIADNAFTLIKIRELNEEGKFWGISNPDTLYKGLVRAIWSTPGFANLNPDGTYQSMAGIANKVVARSIKLVKQGEEFTFSKVMVVVKTNGNTKVRRALSTGVVYAGQKYWDKHGQCRITSYADEGGIKGTLAPLEILDHDLAEAGITVLSMGSLKANRYALEKKSGKAYKDMKKHSVVFKNAPECAVDVVYIDNVTVVITNNYTIQGYMPCNRDRLLQSWDMANDLVAERATAKISLLQEDNVFVEYVQKIRDEEFSGCLSETLEALLVRGDIKRKPTSVSVTSSEYDTMTMCASLELSKQWQNHLLLDKLNLNDVEKDLEFKRLLELTKSEFPEKAVKTITAEEFYAQYVVACKAHGINPGVTPSAFLKRNFLVSLFLGLFADEGKYEWMRITSGKTSCMIPMGKVLQGSFAETSTTFETNVAVTGFIGKVLKYVAYGAGSTDQGRYRPSHFQNMARNIRNEVLAAVTGKGVGKLKATGLYAVLSVAWWSDVASDVICTSAKRYSKDSHALMAKHPLLFDMALSGVTVFDLFPSDLLEGLSETTINAINLIFGNTMFVSEDMLLALQNDCDGDLARLTWHEGMSFELFTPKTLNADAVGSEWFLNYQADEQGFDKVKEIPDNTYTVTEIADAMIGAKFAKDCVAIFTNNAQMFAQRCVVDLGLAKDDIRYNTIHKVLNIWVQEFSMNAIKHKAGSDEDLLPEYYLVSKLKFLKMTGTEMNPGQFLLLEWLAEKGMDMANHGFKNNLDFARVLHYCMCNLNERSLGATLIGKDLRLTDIKPEDHIKFKGSVTDHFHKEIMQDRLVLAYAKKLGFE